MHCRAPVLREFSPKMVSYKQDLYLYGGLPSGYFLQNEGPRPGPRRCYCGNDQFMVKLDQETYSWDPVSLKGAPEESWLTEHSASQGQLLLGTQDLLTVLIHSGVQLSACCTASTSAQTQASCDNLQPCCAAQRYPCSMVGQGLWQAVLRLTCRSSCCRLTTLLGS